MGTGRKTVSERERKRGRIWDQKEQQEQQGQELRLCSKRGKSLLPSPQLNHLLCTGLPVAHLPRYPSFSSSTNSSALLYTTWAYVDTTVHGSLQ